MARPETIHVCSECGHAAAKWHGQCPGCGAWNTLVEQRAPARGAGGQGGASGTRGSAGRGASGLGVRSGGLGARPGAAAATPRPLAEVQAERAQRLSTGIGELDRVLGGGLVPGELVLLGGSPGIGKSTLTNMVLGHLQQAGVSTLYISGEESVEQVRLRAERLAVEAALQVPVLAETDLDVVLATLDQHAPQVCVVDSVQTLRSAEISGAPGTVGQVREVAMCLMDLAKARGIAILLVGHVTKEGSLAGPRVLEHLVDCVLQFEGERERPYRELRALKNRFGSTNEAGLFEMRQGGLVEVLDASARFVAEATRAPGSVLLAAMEGSRPLLVEVQALVAPSELEQPRRVVSGLDRNRLALVLAILARHGHISTGAADVFVNVVGGVRIDEPGVDLAIALAVASASRGVPIQSHPLASHPSTPPESQHRSASNPASHALAPRACFGELGLTGELRWVGHPERRLAEAARHGCADAIAPLGSGEGAVQVPSLKAALAAALPPRRAARSGLRPVTSGVNQV